MVIDSANGEGIWAFGMKTCGTPIGEHTFEGNWIQEKPRKVTGTVIKTTSRRVIFDLT